jgi:hypothetical protein
VSNLIEQIYGQFTEEQLNNYQEQVTAAVAKGIPKQMIFQYFLQAAYATLEELGPKTGLNNDQQNQVALDIAHKLYIRASQNVSSQSNNNGISGSDTEHS